MARKDGTKPALTSPPAERDQPAPWWLRRPLPALLIVVAVVYGRVLSAGFVRLDDDLHVYANPFLNPPTWQSVARLWQHPYGHLYVPLAYTIFGAIARFAAVPAHVDGALGQSLSLDPTVFHAVGLGLHLVNTCLCFHLVRRLSGRSRAAWLCALLFALHPLQLESVAWISELRGLTSGAFVLLALIAFVGSRRAVGHRRRSLLLASVPLVTAAMLCKPSAAVAPLAALAIDRIVFGTPWRKALLLTSLWAAVALPFVLITHAVQGVSGAGQSLWWQRPFIAGDALAFYLFKLLAPIDLCVDYGRTPREVMSHVRGYLSWLVPASLLTLAYLNRRRRPLTWLGTLLIVTFLAPTLGLVPFAFQAYSTVADRYAYLALMGVGLVVFDTVEHVRARVIAGRVAAVALAALAILSFSQSRHWRTSRDFLDHTIDVNPTAGFAYNNRGDTELAKGELTAALADYQACVRHDPTRAKAYINLAEVYTALAQPAEAERAIAQATQAPDITADDFSNLGIVLMKMKQPARALQALATAVAMEPDSPPYLFNQANALAAVAQFDQAEAAFRRCLALAPTLTGAHTGLGIVLAETGRLANALGEFQAALRLQPEDAAALDDLKKAEALVQQGR